MPDQPLRPQPAEPKNRVNESIELQTPRLRLRQWRDDDLEPFAAMNADLRVMEFFPAPLTRAQSDAMALRCHTLIAERGWGFWAVESVDARFMGYVGLHVPTAELPCAPCVEIGWRLAYAHWGQGFATEAARASLRFGFEELGLDEIVAFTAYGNSRSRAVMQRLGMRESGIFEHPQVPPDSDLRLHRLYRLSGQAYGEQSS